MAEDRKSKRVQTLQQNGVLPSFISSPTSQIPNPIAPIQTLVNQNRPNPRKTRKEINRDYLEKKKADPVIGPIFKEAEKIRSQLKRDNATEEQKKKWSDQAKIRVRKYRQKMRELAENQPAKPKTRKDQAQIVEQREKWAEAKRKQRAARSSQKKVWDDTKRRQKYHEKKQLKIAVNKKSIETMTDQMNQDSDVENSIRTPEAKRKALSRARQALPTSPTKYASTVADLVNINSPRKVDALQSIGIDKESIAVGKKVLNSINELHGKCDNESRKRRKILISAATTGSHKKDSQLFKINIKGLIKGNRAGQLSSRCKKSLQMRKEVSSFYEENSAPLPLKKKV